VRAKEARMGRPRAQRGAQYSRWAVRRGIYHDATWMLVVLRWYHAELARLGIESHAEKAHALAKYHR
jgi:hypothetical protein